MNTWHKTKNKIAQLAQHSLFYDKLLPLVFVLLGTLTLFFILVAAGVVLGVIPYR